MSQSSRYGDKIRVGTTFSVIEVQVLQIIEKIVGRKLRVYDLIGHREITRLSGFWYNGCPRVYRGRIALSGLGRGTFQFCLKETESRWLSSEYFNHSGEDVIELYSRGPKVSVIVAETDMMGLHDMRYFVGGSGRPSFREIKIDPVLWSTKELEKYWGGRVPEAVRKQYA